MGHCINYNIDTRLREANLRSLENTKKNESEETNMTNIARYGMNVNITIIDEEHFCAEITVYNRKELNAWLSSHPEIRLVSMPLPRKG